jgi:hypothetical protein
MTISTTLTTIGGLSILAATAGVSLGRDAAGEIDPVYYQPVESHFYADLSPNRSSGTAQPDPGGSDYIQADYSYLAAATRDYPVEYRPRHDRWVDGVDDGWSASAPVAEDAAEVSIPTDPPPPNRAWVERYTDYTLVADPAPVQAAAPAPASAEPGGTPAQAQDQS